MSTSKVHWKVSDWERAQRMRRGGMSYRHIAETLHISEDRVKMKFNNEACRFRVETGTDKPHKSGPPPSVLIERERATRAEVSLTASLCGDPLPGRSALDKQRANLSAPPLLDPDIKAGLSNP